MNYIYKVVQAMTWGYIHAVVPDHTFEKVFLELDPILKTNVTCQKIVPC